ncbi:hypothetical protein MBLNU459_g3517t1 [Dothideomycetes sp. NU459]
MNDQQARDRRIVNNTPLSTSNVPHTEAKTDMSSTKPQAMANAVLIPIENLTAAEGGEDRIRGKEERLKAIISNLDAHQQTVRNNILAMPISMTPAATTTPAGHHQPDKLNIPEIFRNLDARPAGMSESQIRNYLLRVQKTAASELAAADLRSLPPEIVDRADGIERMVRLNEYDRHAANARENYVKTFERYETGDYTLESRGASGSARIRSGEAKTGRTGVAPQPGMDGMRASAPVANPNGDDGTAAPVQRKQSMGAGASLPEIDASRDPRRRRGGV